MNLLSGSSLFSQMYEDSFNVYSTYTDCIAILNIYIFSVCCNIGIYQYYINCHLLTTASGSQSPWNSMFLNAMKCPLLLSFGKSQYSSTLPSYK